MTEGSTPSKTELLAALRASGEQMQSSLRGLPPEQFESGRYDGGWTGRQILAHIAAIEWTLPKLLDLARQGMAGTPDAQPPAAVIQGGPDAYNERQIARRAHASVAELIEEFARNRAATIDAVAAAEDALLATPIRSGGGITGPAAAVLQWVGVEHCLGHARDIAGIP